MVRIDPNTPVIVGVAQTCDRVEDPAEAPAPLDSMERVVQLALEDAGGMALPEALDWLAVIRTVPDSMPLPSPGWNYDNIAGSVANRLNVRPRRLTYPAPSGNSPQLLVNMFADAIAKGQAEFCVLVGAENARTAAHARRTGVQLDWRDDSAVQQPDVLGDESLPTTKAEFKHGAYLAPTMYAMYDNALTAKYGRTPQEQRVAIGRLMETFSTVAAMNPHSVAHEPKSAEQLITPSDDNRFIAYPYTKYLCANNSVDQAAGLVMMSTAAADRYGIDPSKRVYLHGCGDTQDTWFVSDRSSYTSSPAIERGAREALDNAGVTLADIDFFDIYSCFPAAVQIAADALGLAHDDPRGLTVTGGLPYFGGPGNNYSTHAIAEMVQRLRRAREKFGFVHANGGFLTKHSFGVYSTTPPARPFERADPATYQSELDAAESPRFDEKPSGAGTIETFTVVHNKGRPVRAIVFGRLDSTGDRFIANIFDANWLRELIGKPAVGRAITVTPGNPVNYAELVGVPSSIAGQPDPVLFEVDGAVAIVTINRPDVRNAINAAVAAGLEAAVRRVESDPTIHAAILTAAGDKAFSAGVDLTELAAGRGAEISRPGSGFAGFVQASRTKPWIAAVRGSALGGGLELCLACDMIVAGHDSELGLPEVRRGLIAGAGGVIRLPRVVPRAIAYEMIATGIAITGTRAAQLGLVNRAVDSEKVLIEALDLAQTIAANAPLSVIESLCVARQSFDASEIDLWKTNAAAANVVLRSADASEGPRAFTEKRPPMWTGR